MAERADIERFVEAQRGVYETALAELAAGRKRSHWMWFVFPQMRGLGLSPTADFYGVASLDEARAYLVHPRLGPRLEACTRAILAVQGRSLHDIFGSPDDLKFRSSMTLFDRADSKPDNLFVRALAQFFDGAPDRKTIELIDARTPR